MSASLTDSQKATLRRVVASWDAGEVWYRAQTAGERVTLASLATQRGARQLLERRARRPALRGIEETIRASGGYEYRPHPTLYAALQAKREASRAAS